MVVAARALPVILTLLATTGPLAPVAASNSDSGVDPATAAVRGYLIALADGDYASARSFWHPSDLQRSERLGIRYDGVPLKVDSASLLWSLPPGILSDCTISEPRPLRPRVPHPAQPFEVSVGTTYEEQEVSWDFVVDSDSNGVRLTSPVGLFLRESSGRSSGYLRTHGTPLPKPAITSLDSFVAVTLDRLQVPTERWRLLQVEKLDFIHVDPTTVEELAGAPTVGIANLQFDTVISRHPCHFHELAHLLINFWLEQLPLYTLPVLQEGSAVHFGGRWGRSPGVLMQVGRYVLDAEFLQLDELLTWNGFRRQPADLTYAPAGVFVGWILDEAGPEGLRRLYLRLSGTAEQLERLSANQIKREIADVLACHPEDLEARFSGYRSSLPDNPMHAPSSSEPIPPEPRCEIAKDDLTIVLWEAADRWFAEIRGTPDVPPHGTLLVTGGAPVVPRTGGLIEEHLAEHEVDPGHEANHAVGGLRFSPHEIGWYDYERDLLLAKHVEQFWPSTDYYDAASGAVRITWPSGMLPWSMNEANFEIVQIREP